MTSPTQAPPYSGSFVLTGIPQAEVLAEVGYTEVTTSSVTMSYRDSGPPLGTCAPALAPVSVGQDWVTFRAPALGSSPLYSYDLDRASGRWIITNDRFAATRIAMAWHAEDGTPTSAVEMIEGIAPLPACAFGRYHRDDSEWQRVDLQRPPTWLPTSVTALSDDDLCQQVLGRLQHAVGGIANLYDRPVVLLSGGVDSGLVAALAKLANPNTVALSLGTPWGSEFAGASRTADALGLHLTKIELPAAQLQEAVSASFSWLQQSDPEACLIQLLVTEARRLAHNLGDTLVTGMGSDLLNATTTTGIRSMDTDPAELGAATEQLAARVTSTMQTGLFYSGAWHPQGSMGPQVHFPYWERDLIRSQLMVPTRLKAGEGFEKNYLRQLAQAYLPAETAWAPKQAIHEGGGLAEGLTASLRRNGDLQGDPFAAIWRETVCTQTGAAD